MQRVRLDLGCQSNITLIDDVRVKDIIDKPSMMMSLEEIDMLSKHWIGYSIYTSPEVVWMYPERI